MIRKRPVGSFSSAAVDSVLESDLREVPQERSARMPRSRNHPRRAAPPKSHQAVRELFQCLATAPRNRPTHPRRGRPRPPTQLRWEGCRHADPRRATPRLPAGSVAVWPRIDTRMTRVASTAPRLAERPGQGWAALCAVLPSSTAPQRQRGGGSGGVVWCWIHEGRRSLSS